MATARLEPNGDTSIGGNWFNPPIYSKLSQPGNTYPSAPSTSNPALCYDGSATGPTNPDNQILIDMSTQTGVVSVSAITLFYYALSSDPMGDGGTGMIWGQPVINGTPVGSLTNFAGGTNTFTTSYAWYSITFSGLSWTESQLNSLQILLGVDAGPLGEHAQISSAQMYADITYVPPPSITGISSISGISSITF